MNNHTTTRIASIIIGSLIAIVIIFFGFKLFSEVFTRAADVEPRDVVVSDITQNSIKISWSTGQESQGVVEYGTTPTALNFFAPESQSTRTHSLDLTLLSPATTYYFQVRIADKKYDNGGVPWTFTTKSVEKSQPSGSNITKPSPISTIIIPQEPTVVPPVVQSCDETECTKIQEKIGKGCTTMDYIKCINKAASPTAGTP